MTDNNLNERSLLERERALFSDISGADRQGHAKAHVVLRHFLQLANGTMHDIEVFNINKPYVSVFKHAGYVTVSLNFHRKEDVDLQMFFNLLSNYSRPSNSVSYTTEELMNGFYMDNGVQKPVFFPMIQLVLSPIGKETQYQMVGINPVLWNLSPKSPRELDPCILQLAFKEDYFVVTEDLEHFNINELQKEIMMEVEEELMANGNPYDKI